MSKKPRFGQIFLFGLFLWQYAWQRIVKLFHAFEGAKNFVVSILLWKRGVLFRPATHTGVLVLIFIVVIFSFITSGKRLLAQTESPPEFPSYSVTFTDPITVISEKPRDKIIEYQVVAGDTISQISEKFGISVDTIRWANDLSYVDSINPGDKLRILPVTGTAHKVASGETIYSIAKKYQAEPQTILDFPFNDIGDDLALRVGQSLIVPNGVPPSKPKPPPTQYLARSQVVTQNTTADGRFIWPAPGYISQYFSYYHPAIDIVNSSGPAVVAGDSGRVEIAGWPDRTGYGNRVIIDHGNGFTTLYAHLAKVLVSPGDYVGKGQTIGIMGTTGRATGIHVHFEIRKNGVVLNPLSFLK